MKRTYVARRFSLNFVLIFAPAVATALLAAGCGGREAAPIGASTTTEQTAEQTPAAPPADVAPVPKSPAIDPQDLWRLAQLQSAPSDAYSAEQVEEKLIQGKAEPLGELKAIPLNLSLPPRRERAWSGDGRTFFVLQGSDLLRIAVPSWRVTHRVNLSATLGFELTNSGFVERRFEEIGDGTIPTTRVLAMSSEGPVVAIRHVEAAGGKMPQGGEMIYSDERTGRVIEERIVVRQVIVFDQETLAVKRHYYGPASSIAGSPLSPIVAVGEQRRGVGLLDLRSGKMLDADWLRPSAKGDVHGVGIPDILMSSDGKSLYQSLDANECARIDISQGKLHDPAAAAFKVPLARNAMNLMAPEIDSRPPAFELSPDGGRLAVYTRDGSGRTGYILLPTLEKADPRDELRFKAYDHTSSMTFAGSRNRFVYTIFLLTEHILRLEIAGVDGGETQSVFIKLTPEEALAGTSARLCGWPAGEHVLMSMNPKTTLLIQLPPDSEPRD